MDALKQVIYHEKQEPGSMLCAQHALNAILQGQYFSAADLGAIANSLDNLELEYRNRDEHAPSESTNMDDTGFFSSQVLDRALQVWGLTLVPWRSQELAEFHDNPDSQQAFILNLSQHWFTIRRFGAPRGNGTWFNLNSFNKDPERVGVTYLGMVLQQAEEEGYSVFAIRPTASSPHEEAGEHHVIPLSEADELAAAIPDEDAEGGPGPSDVAGDYNFDDEDIELQKALQASLAGDDSPDTPFASSSSRPIPPPSFGVPLNRPASSFAETARRGFGVPFADDSDDPVESSSARANAILERAQAEQAAQMRAIQQLSAGQSRSASGPASRDESATGRRRGEVAEDEDLKRAIAESLKSAGGHVEDDNDDAQDDEDYVPDDDEDYVPTTSTRRTEALPSSLPVPSSTAPLSAVDRGVGRVIDDEDAQLQAALKASLEGLPEGFRAASPPLFDPPIIHTTELSRRMEREAAEREVAEAKAKARAEEDDEIDEDGDEGMDNSQAEASAAAKLDVDEMRKRRLARFGAS